MTRAEYLAQLERYLRKLPKEDYDEVIDYFTELFDDAGPEGEGDLMESLGSPKEAAHEVMVDLLDKKLSDATGSTSRRQVILLVLLGILAAPVGLPILFGISFALMAVFFSLIAVLIGLLAVGVGAFVMGLAVTWDSLALFSMSKSAFLLTFGGGLLAIGMAFLVLLGTIYVIRWGFSLLIHLAKFFINKMKRGSKK